MKQIWDFIQSQILGMKWLNELIGRLISLCGIDIADSTHGVLIRGL